MTHLESKSTAVAKSQKEVYDFLCDFEHFRKLMPPQVIDWTGTSEECSFTIKGMASLSLKYKTRTPNTEVVISSFGKSPFEFEISAKIEEDGSGAKVQFFMNADLNPFLKMMAEKPLGNFLNMLADKIGEVV